MRIRSTMAVMLLCISSLLQAQSLQSPDQFLGYKLGDKFTLHYRIAEYFHKTAESVPSMMKLTSYGRTNEGRELLLAVISSPENMGRIEEIRKNNLRLTGMLNDQPAVKTNPAIVWLSYNVHGDEASSSEVSMAVLYKLLSDKSQSMQNWLSKTVIIIDPCLNPDGRDRYVTKYNQLAGATPDPNPDAAEHRQPWPGGRSNHYHFDLNRDWAWQTQIETKNRLMMYHEWMPQIHCDFHEQYPENPYYFAPGAEPFHEVITPFQRSFQTTIGRNHARYFDANGWLYFTKELFDLLYPSYGDTYPLFNGSIGMTYEQAGHGLAGLAYSLRSGDTLRLSDRIAHHFTTSMSTIEVAAANRELLINNFAAYFENSRNGNIGEYKSYIVSGENRGKLKPLIELFQKNKISYSYASAGKVTRAFNYFTGKEESVTTRENDLIVPAAQPSANLVKVLFEPNSRLSDSATYDITAWALPYAYGIQTYASRDKISGNASGNFSSSAISDTTSYAYLVDYKSFADAKLLANLLAMNMRVRVAEKAFSFNGKKYGLGTLVILRAGNDGKIGTFLQLAESGGNVVTPITSGFMESGFDFGSEKLRLIRRPSIALITGDETTYTAEGSLWFYMDQELHYPVTKINSTDLDRTELRKFQVIIVPDGYYKFLGSKEAATDLRNWVRDGGTLIALENAVSQIAGIDWGLKQKKADDDKDDPKKNIYEDLKRYGERERDVLVENIPGAIYKVELDNTHPLAFGYPDYYFDLKLNANLYEFSRDGWNVGVIKKEKQVSGFVGSKAAERIKDGTVIGVMPMSRGSLIYFSDDPVFRAFWENGKLMMANALFFAGQ